MRVGIIVPQGWTGEYDGWEPARAWARTVAVAHESEALGFDSIWLFDHVQTEPVPTDEITFEAFVGLSALAAETARVRLGHLVLCSGYRNPALVAKMISTLDVVSGGRAELGLGAGWKEDEYTAYGWGFPSLRNRMALLEDSLEICSRMLAGGRVDVRGLAGVGPGRDQRPARHPGATRPDPRGRQRPEPDVAPRGPLRRRAQPRLVLARGGRRRAAGHRVALRGDRARPGHAPRCR